MDPIKIAEILSYLSLVPSVIPIVIGVASQIKVLLDNGEEVTDNMIEALIDEAIANHNALPTPESK